MQSAAILAQETKDRAKAEALAVEELDSITTVGAIITEDDRILLHGNPLNTITEILCPTCRLPRLNHPETGKNSRPPDPSKKYCVKHPYIDKEGCDIYGMSLTLEKPSKKKATVPNKQKPNDSRSGSESPGGSPNGGHADKKPAATTVPSGKCPNCPRYMAFTRIAQHMDRCMGFSGRQSSKAALSKMNSGTPRDTSRASTPKPSGPQGSAAGPGSSSQGTGNTKKRKLDKGSDNEEEESEKTPMKKKKTGTGKKGGKVGKAVNADVARVKGTAEKRLPGQGEGAAGEEKKAGGEERND